MNILKVKRASSGVVAVGVIVGDTTLTVYPRDGHQVPVLFRSFPRLEALTPHKRVYVEARHMVEGRLSVNWLASASAAAGAPFAVATCLRKGMAR